MALVLHRADYGRAVQTSVRDNFSAFGYSLAITVSYGICSHGSQVSGVGQDMLFLGGACLAFLVVVAAASRGFRRHVTGESSRVDLLASAFDVTAVAAAAGTAGLVTLLRGSWIWPVGGFSVTAVYLLVGALDVLVAREVVSKQDERDKQDEQHKQPGGR